METYHLLPSTLNFSTSLNNENNEVLHDHSFFELFYVKNGNITHNALNSREKLGVGDAYLICPGIPHRFTREKSRCERRDVLIRPVLFKTACDFINENLYNDIAERKIVHFKLSDEDVAFYERCFAMFLSDANSDISRKNYEKVLVVQLLGSVCIEAGSMGVGNSLDFRNRCLLSINNHYIDPQAIEFVYSELGYNRIYLSKKFKQEFGVTLTDYILSLRLNHAAFLLQTSAYSVSECCYAIGLGSVPYFINAFKRKYGVTPAKYRKSATRKNKK